MLKSKTPVVLYLFSGNERKTRKLVRTCEDSVKEHLSSRGDVQDRL